MNSLNALHAAGQCIWLDYIHRTLLTSGKLTRYITDYSVTGLTSNPTIFEHAIASGSDYDTAIFQGFQRGLTPEDVFIAIALEDITTAADLFRPVYAASDGNDGLVSLEVSPRLADDAQGTIAEARRLYALAGRPNVLIKVPGTAAGRVAIEELIGAGVPVNVTLLFSTEHYLAAAEAYLKGIERRLAAGHDVRVASVASLFISRWDTGTAAKLPAPLRNRLGIAVAQRTYRAYQELLASGRWRRLAEAGARPQRLLWASTGTKDPSLPDTYYVTALAAAQTVNTLPEATLLAFGQHGEVGALLTTDDTGATAVMRGVTEAGIDVEALAAELQLKGRDAFSDSFTQLLRQLEAKYEQLCKAQGGADKRLAGAR
jgi:transaldolase